MNKYEIDNQKVQNNKNISIIKNENKEQKGIYFVIEFLTSNNIELIERILDKL